MLVEFIAYHLVGGPFNGQVQFMPADLPAGFTLVKAPRLTDEQCFALAESGLFDVIESPSVRHAYLWTGGQTLTHQGEVKEAPAFCNGGGI